MFVSIPYGKGKADPVNPETDFPEYQFPMGKVKSSDVFDDNGKRLVSIPYGKGKEKEKIAAKYSYLVSIPYGKGKANGISTLKRLLHGINYLWERESLETSASKIQE